MRHQQRFDSSRPEMTRRFTEHTVYAYLLLLYNAHLGIEAKNNVFLMTVVIMLSHLHVPTPADYT